MKKFSAVARDKESGLPKKYVAGLSASTAKARAAHWKKTSKMSDSDPRSYEPAPGDATAKTKLSKYTKKYHKMFGEQIGIVIEGAPEKIEGTNCANCIHWVKESEKPVDKSELNEYGGLKAPNEAYVDMSKHADLVTLPGKAVVKVKAYCNHEDIHDFVTERMCCAYWDGEGVKREYKGISPKMDESLELDETIVKVDGKFRLMSKKTGRNLGTYDTKAGAMKRERQVQYFKHMGEEKMTEYKPKVGDHISTIKGGQNTGKVEKIEGGHVYFRSDYKRSTLGRGDDYYPIFKTHVSNVRLHEEVEQTNESAKDWKKAFKRVARKNLEKDVAYPKASVYKLDQSPRLRSTEHDDYDQIAHDVRTGAKPRIKEEIEAINEIGNTEKGVERLRKYVASDRSKVKISDVIAAKRSADPEKAIDKLAKRQGYKAKAQKKIRDFDAAKNPKPKEEPKDWRDDVYPKRADGKPMYYHSDSYEPTGDVIKEGFLSFLRKKPPKIDEDRAWTHEDEYGMHINAHADAMAAGNYEKAKTHATKANIAAAKHFNATGEKIRDPGYTGSSKHIVKEGFLSLFKNKSVVKTPPTVTAYESVEQIDEMDKSLPAPGRDSDKPFPKPKPIKLTDTQRTSAKLMTKELLNLAKKQLKKEEVEQIDERNKENKAKKDAFVSKLGQTEKDRMVKSFSGMKIQKNYGAAARAKNLKSVSDTHPKTYGRGEVKTDNVPRSKNYRGSYEFSNVGEEVEQIDERNKENKEKLKNKLRTIGVNAAITNPKKVQFGRSALTMGRDALKKLSSAEVSKASRYLPRVAEQTNGVEKSKKLERERRIRDTRVIHHQNRHIHQAALGTMGESADKSLAAKAAKSGISVGTLRKVYNRGVAAWNSGHRPGTTPQQWGHARVNSYITKGKTFYTADKDLRREEVEQTDEAVRVVDVERGLPRKSNVRVRPWSFSASDFRDRLARAAKERRKITGEPGVKGFNKPIGFSPTKYMDTGYVRAVKKEEVEQIDEVGDTAKGRAVLRSYVKKKHDQYHKNRMIAKTQKQVDWLQKDANKNLARAEKRLDAVRSEEFDINEAFEREFNDK